MMKKTLAALIVGAFAASAANATVIYNNEGTEVELNGSLRIVLEKSNKGGEGNKHTHSGLRNSGSRIELNVKHNLADDYYAFGRLQVRFDGKQGGTVREDGFGNLNTNRAYIGLGKGFAKDDKGNPTQFSELTFGRQVTIADDLSTSKDYAYGIVEKGDYIPTEGRAVIRYDYKNTAKNFQVGASYQFADDRTSDVEASESWKIQDDRTSPNGYKIVKVKTPAVLGNEVVDGSIKNAYQVGAFYEDKAIVKFGYGRTNYKSTTNQKHHKDGFLLSLGYNFGVATTYVDSGYARIKNGETTNKFFVAPGFIIPVSKLSSVYGNYKYEQSKEGNEKTKLHGFLLGVDYQLHKQVKTFIEGKYQVSKDYVNGTYVDGSKVKDKAIGVGMRVYF